jgi:hypothetical protein
MTAIAKSWLSWSGWSAAPATARAVPSVTGEDWGPMAEKCTNCGNEMVLSEWSKFTVAPGYYVTMKCPVCKYAHKFDSKTKPIESTWAVIKAGGPHP